MYHALQFDQLRIQEAELSLRLAHRNPWAQPDAARTTTSRRRRRSRSAH